MSTPPWGAAPVQKRSAKTNQFALRQCKSGQTIFVWSGANIIVAKRLPCQVNISDPKLPQTGVGRPKFLTFLAPV